MMYYEKEFLIAGGIIASFSLISYFHQLNKARTLKKKEILQTEGQYAEYVIVKEQDGEGATGKYKLSLTYYFEVDEKSYWSSKVYYFNDNLSLFGRKSYCDISEDEDALRKKAISLIHSTVKIYYNKRRPTESFLEYGTMVELRTTLTQSAKFLAFWIVTVILIYHVFNV